MVDIGDSLTYPMESEQWIKTILIGGILSIFGFLIIPLVLVYGYIIQVLRARYDGQPEPPEFGDWGGLLSDGLKAVVIGVVYLLIPGIVGAVTVGGSMLAFLTGTEAGVATGFAGLFGGFIISFILGLVFGYIAVAAVLNFAHKGEIGAGFEFGTIKELISSREYAFAWLAAVGVFIGMSVISGFLNMIPLLGMIVSAFLFFYAQIVAAYLWADGFTEVIEEGGEVESS